MKEFFKSPVAKIYYDSTLDSLFLEYTSKVPSDEQFIVVNSELLKAFKQLQTQKFVADIRKMGIISLASQQWIVDTLIPGMINHLKGRTLYHAQLLDPKEILSKVSGANIRDKSKKVIKDFEVVQVSDIAELHQYLKNIPQ